jgi:hypothetical protein
MVEQDVDVRMLLQWIKKLNVAVKWLIFLLRIREVSCSNLDPETGYPDMFSWFISVPSVKWWDFILNYATATFFQILIPLIIQLSPSDFTPHSLR